MKAEKRCPASILKLNREYRNGDFLSENEPNNAYLDCLGVLNNFRSNPARLSAELHRMGIHSLDSLATAASE